jgi:heme/copper-type cytochrome/quinol oxidase subunit 4
MSDPIKVFTVIALISLPTVMFGGYSLLRLLTREQLNEFQRTYFRAGHAHAGVLVVLTLVSLNILAGTDLGTGARWVICLPFLVGVLAQSGGMFVHMAKGTPGQWSAGNKLSTAGPAVLAVALLSVAYGVIIT